MSTPQDKDLSAPQLPHNWC